MTNINTPRPARPLVFGYSYAPFGVHPAAWSDGETPPDAFDPNYITIMAQLAEEGGFDFIQIAERAPSAGGIAGVARTEPFTTASFLATRTRSIGFIVAANTSYYEPYNVTRLVASLDHVTHGRAGWQVVTGAERTVDHNYSRATASADDHHIRAAETVEIARKLWDSWEDEAFVRNKQTGEYVDGAKIHPIDHRGQLFSIKGPLNVAHPPQGQPVVAVEVLSPLTHELAAREADVILLTGPDDQLAGQARALRSRAQELGRDPADLTILARLTPIIGETPDAAIAYRDRLSRATNGKPSTLAGEITGDASEIADAIADRAETLELDGFLIQVARSPDQLRAYVDLVAPELRRRNILVADDSHVTLRDRLGLARPANRYAAA
jgi:alkanesulfonate monooxygenase SsuD/methylene tetrahydromethanopterin reductase-like flavin-dependent oxidoreductase (luciferase family)